MGRFSTISVRDHEEMERRLAEELEKRLKDRGLVVAVLAHPKDAFTVTHITPLTHYWHHRSKDSVDFVFLGYRKAVTNGASATVDVSDFSDEDFVRSVEEFEKTGWRYSGRPSVLVFQVIRKGLKAATFDFSAVIAVDLEAAVRENVVPSVTTLFEWIVRLGRETPATIAVWSLSDSLGARTFAAGLGEYALNVLRSKDLKRVLKPIDLFRVQNFRNTT